MSSARLEVDGVTYDLDYLGHDRPLAAWTADGEALHLEPWRLGQHLAALGHATRVHGEALALDPTIYAAHVLGDADAIARWGPLALWWAAGAADPDPPPGYRLRPWSLLERACAVQAALDPSTDSFHVGRFLTALVADCVLWAGLVDPLALPLTRGAPLLAAACRACAPEPLLPPATADPALRRLTLRVCAALGWSPAQVWRCPAGEVDQLLALLDLDPPSRPRPGLSTLAGLADTHTFNFEE